MVVIDPLDIAVEVRVDDEELTEYPDERFDRHNTNVVRPGDDLFEGVRLAGTDIHGDCRRPKKIVVSKYIQATTNSEFTVVFCIGVDMPFRKDTTRVAVFVDGKYGDSRLVNWNHKPSTKPYRDVIKGHRKGVNSSNAQVFAFRFAKLNIVEDAFRFGNESAMGVIRVEFYRVVSWKGGKPHKWKNLRSADSRKVSERSLKKGEAVSHGIGWTEPYDEKRFWATNVKYIDDQDHPFAEVRFKFRDKKALQDLLILPRTPCPSLSPTPIRTRNTTMRNEDYEDSKEAVQLIQHGQEFGDDLEDMKVDDTSSSTDGEDSVVFVSQRVAPESMRSRHPVAGDVVHEIFDDDHEDDHEVLTSRRHIISTNETIVNPYHNHNESRPRPNMVRQADCITIPDEDDAYEGTRSGFPQGTNYIMIPDDNNEEASSGTFQNADYIVISDDEDDSDEGNALFWR